MSNLVTILLLLFVTLFLVVKLTERFGKPMSDEKQSKLSTIAMVAIFILLVSRLLNEYL